MRGVGDSPHALQEGATEAPARHGSAAIRTGARMHGDKPHGEIIADGSWQGDMPGDEEARFMEWQIANPRALAFLEDEAIELADNGKTFTPRELIAKAQDFGLIKSEPMFEDCFLPYVARSLVNINPRLAWHLVEDAPHDVGEAASCPPEG